MVLLVAGHILLVKGVNHKEILSAFFLQIDIIYYYKVGQFVIDCVSPVVGFSQDVLTGVHKHFNLVANLHF